jgi:predicted CoA-binding protein
MADGAILRARGRTRVTAPCGHVMARTRGRLERVCLSSGSACNDADMETPPEPDDTRQSLEDRMDETPDGHRTDTPDRDRTRADRDRVRALLDLQEGRSPVPVLGDDGIADLLRSARRIAVVGASAKPWRPSHGVMASLLAAGYQVVPVRPRLAEVLGRRCYPDLASAVAAEGPIDIVDVFRNADACPAHAREAVAVGARCLWLQLGVVSWEAAEIAARAGLAVVMDRCTAIELHRLLR